MGRISDAARESDDHVLHQVIYIHVDNMFLPAALSFGILVYERGDYPTSRLPLTMSYQERASTLSMLSLQIHLQERSHPHQNSSFSMIGIFN